MSDLKELIEFLNTVAKVTEENPEGIIFYIMFLQEKTMNNFMKAMNNLMKAPKHLEEMMKTYNEYVEKSQERWREYFKELIERRKKTVETVKEKTMLESYPTKTITPEVNELRENVEIRSKRDQVYSTLEIISTYLYEGNFKLARDRLNTVKSLNIMPLKIADAMLAVIEIIEKCNTKITLDFIKRKYEFILDLFKEHKEEFENSENIGNLIRKIELYQIENSISDELKETVKNVFCRALLEKIKIIAYRSAEE